MAAETGDDFVRVVSDLDAQFEFTIDTESEPADLDTAVARFLLTMVRSSSFEDPPRESTEARRRATTRLLAGASETDDEQVNAN